MQVIAVSILGGRGRTTNRRAGDFSLSMIPARPTGGKRIERESEKDFLPIAFWSNGQGNRARSVQSRACRNQLKWGRIPPTVFGRDRKIP
jgi:hypothetical protein